MNYRNILDLNSEDIEQTLNLAEEFIDEKIKLKDIPWCRNIYFMDDSLCIEQNIPNGIDTMIFNFRREKVVFYKCLYRQRLLSIKSCKTLERILVKNHIPHTSKWL